MEHACKEARDLARRTNRRAVLSAASLGVLGLSLGDMFALQQVEAASRDDYACIMLWLTGGPSQFDSFDPKPDAPSEVRGPFKPIPTNVDGIRFTEVFPQVARHADKIAVLRSVYHPLDNHVLAQGWMTAGRIHDTVNYPPMGSVLACLKPGDGMLPPFVTLPRMKLIEGYNETHHFQTAGDLGAAFNPLIPEGIPGEAGFTVRDLPQPVESGRFARREKLLARVDPPLRRDGVRSPREGMQAVYRRAFELIHSTKVRQAFDLEAEPGKLRDAYGRNGFGQATLVSRRLVEAGARFVTVNWPSYFAWDQHGSIEGGMKSTGGTLDAALSSLLQDLSDRGLLSRTMVMVMGEFGRTPKLNSGAGRDHWVNVMSVLMAGGRVRGGQVYGSSTAEGYPDEKPLHARDMVATAYAALGVNPDATIDTVIGRPISILPEASVVREILR